MKVLRKARRKKAQNKSGIVSKKYECSEQIYLYIEGAIVASNMSWKIFFLHERIHWDFYSFICHSLVAKTAPFCNGGKNVNLKIFIFSGFQWTNYCN